MTADPPRLKPIVISTIGDLIDNRHHMTAHCDACQHHSAVDLEKLAAALGRDRSYIGLKLPMRCSRCGGTKISTTIGGPAWQYIPQGKTEER